ncbi:MAG: hypothetical protein KF782_28460 [Labilithrix sp.]|nr:hypothetical protein [Labilithrix sp.]
MKRAVRSLAELGEDVVLAPERWVAAAEAGDGIPLGDLVVERRERAESAPRAVVLDTTHARDGLLDIPAAVRAAPAARSAKKSARAGDLVVSRLRPYLRQIALVHPRALEAASDRPLAVSTEFYVLAPRREGDDLAFLLPFLLGERAQSVLAAAQEGGHHPRVPRSSLFALRVPATIVEARRRLSREVNAALDVLYDASSRYQRLLRR